jgi:hypothetical protein
VCATSSGPHCPHAHARASINVTTPLTHAPARPPHALGPSSVRVGDSMPPRPLVWEAQLLQPTQLNIPAFTRTPLLPALTPTNLWPHTTSSSSSIVRLNAMQNNMTEGNRTCIPHSPGFGTVFRGYWHKVVVAVKVMHTRKNEREVGARMHAPWLRVDGLVVVKARAWLRACACVRGFERGFLVHVVVTHFKLFHANPTMQISACIYTRQGALGVP